MAQKGENHGPITINVYSNNDGTTHGANAQNGVQQVTPVETDGVLKKIWTWVTKIWAK